MEEGREMELMEWLNSFLQMRRHEHFLSSLHHPLQYFFVLHSNSFYHHPDVMCFSFLQFVCMALLTAVDMGTRSFILHVPAHVDASAAANVLVKAGGLDAPPSGQPQTGLTSSPLASSMPPLRASPYETGLCVDKGSAGSSAGVLFCWLRVFILTHSSVAKEQPRQLQRARLK